MTRSLLFSLAAVSLLACGGDKDDDDTTDTTVADTDTDADTDADADADTDADADADTDTDTDSDTDTGTLLGTIVEIAADDPQFSTLVDLVVRVGLDATLAGPGPYTVFAPTNDAFTALGIDPATLTDQEVEDILLYHVIPSEVPSTSIPALADSANDLTLFFDTSSGVMVNDATVSIADIGASNGIIHVVDGVLLPPTIVDAAVYAGLDQLVGAVTAADPAVAGLLSGPGDLTVFAPTNDAFDEISGVVAGLSVQELTDILTYHVIGARVDSGSVPAFGSSALLNRYDQPVSLVFDTSVGVMVNGETVVIADVKTTNGIVHVVDGVLLPPTVVDLAGHAQLDGLLDAVGAATGDLGTVLATPGPFTVFAPDNQAFADAAGIVATLTPEEIEDVLLFHVVGGNRPVGSADLMAGEVPSLLGPSLTVDLTSGVMVENASVVQADVFGTNGVVHVIDAVMLPPTGN